MPYFKIGNQDILLIHIPKTGGTSVELYFSQKYNIPLNIHSLYFIPNNLLQQIAYSKQKWQKKINIMIEEEKQKLKQYQKTKTHFLIQKNKNILQWQAIKHSLPEFKEFINIKLVRELDHSLQHLTFSEMVIHRDILWKNNVSMQNNILNKNCTIITIVRNPYDRIISELFYIKWLSLTNNTPQIVYEILKKYLNSPNTFDNHKLPQYTYLIDADQTIHPNIKILKTETLTNDMHNLGYTDFDKKTNTTNSKYNSKYTSLLNSQSIQLINEYYAKDFEYFGYSKL